MRKLYMMKHNIQAKDTIFSEITLFASKSHIELYVQSFIGYNLMEYYLSIQEYQTKILNQYNIIGKLRA